MTDDTAADSSIDLKKRARRRLVGAAALALLAIIVLPIVMDSEPKPSGQEIQIRIPAKDGDALVSHVIPARPAPLLPHQDVAKSAPPSAVADAPPTPVQPAENPAAIKPKPPAVDSDAAKKSEAAHAEAVLEGKDSGQWIVQLGAYQNTANVKQLTAKLKDMGLPSYTEKLDSPQGARTRVRAGPFKSQDAADKARLRIKKIGIDGSVAQKQ